MTTQASIQYKLAREMGALIEDTNNGFDRMRVLVKRAFAAKEAGDLPEARIVLNEALDVEYAITGDCKVLGDLFEEWGGEHERDQRPGVTVDGECLACGAMHADGPCP